MSTQVFVELVTEPTVEVRELIDALEVELSAHYTQEQRHGLKLEAIFQPHIAFFVARIAGAAAGCGGIAFFESFAELKRMYVRPEFRGSGVADAVASRLQQEAKDRGITSLRLETGSAQVAAIRFYERHGFRICEAFEPYSSMPPSSIATSVFMEKQIV